MDSKLEQMRSTALVTGGTTGIGYSVVRRLLSSQYKVAFLSSDPAKVEAASAQLGEEFDTDHFIGACVDLRSPEAIETVFQEVRFRFGDIGVLVNNAGISKKIDGRRVPLHETTLAQWQDVFAVNLTAAFLCTKAALPSMIKARYGRIAMIGSIAARSLPQFAGADYVASKAGLAGLVRSIAAEYGAFGIAANTVAPGNVATGMTGPPDSPQNRNAVHAIPAGRIGLSEDIAEAVAFLCSAEAEFINGATLDVTGGEFVPT